MNRAGGSVGRALCAVAVAIVSLGLAACSPRDNGTLLVVRVDTDLSVPDQIDTIAIDVVPEGHAMVTNSFSVSGRAALPLRYGIRPKGSPDLKLQITARGVLGGSTVVSQAAEVAFVPGEAREFTLLLASACIANPAACPTQTPVLAPYVPGGSDGGAGGDDGGARDAGMREARPAVGHFVSVASPNPAAALNAVWALGPDDVWAVGAVGPTGVAYHYQQGAWTDTMFPAGTTVLYGVWASAPDSVWAVGGAATYALWNGTTWTTMQLSPSGPLPPTLTGVWGAGPDDVWIVGTGGTLAHVRRSGQKDQQVIGSADLAAVWGTSTDEVWAVGTGGAVLRRTGGAWNPQTQSVSRNPLYGVWLSAPSDVWAVGNGVTLHFDGVAWARISDPLNVPLAIWGSAPDDVWSVGGATAAAGTPFITRFDGVAFSMVDTPVAMALQSVRGSSASNVWAVGSGGLVLRLQVP